MHHHPTTPEPEWEPFADQVAVDPFEHGMTAVYGVKPGPRTPTLDEARAAAKKLRRKQIVATVDRIAAITHANERTAAAAAFAYELGREYDPDHRAERNLRPQQPEIAAAAEVLVNWLNGGAR